MHARLNIFYSIVLPLAIFCRFGKISRRIHVFCAGLSDNKVFEARGTI